MLQNDQAIGVLQDCQPHSCYDCHALTWSCRAVGRRRRPHCLGERPEHHLRRRSLHSLSGFPKRDTTLARVKQCDGERPHSPQEPSLTELAHHSQEEAPLLVSPFSCALFAKFGRGRSAYRNKSRARMSLQNASTLRKVCPTLNDSGKGGPVVAFHAPGFTHKTVDRLIKRSADSDNDCSSPV